MYKIKCDLCGQEISASNYNSHLRRHKNHPETFIVPRYRLNHDGLSCQYCKKQFKNANSLCNHERQCKNNPDRQESGFVFYNTLVKKGIVKVWNKGLTKENDERVKKLSSSLKGNGTNRSVSTKTREKLSRSMKAAYAEGRIGHRLHRVHHDRNYYGTYKGYECDSSWELAYVIYNIDNNVKFQRNTEFFLYTFNGSIHKYFPDFVLEDGTFVEVKGITTDRDIAKWRDFPKEKSLLIIDEKAIRPYIEYCVKVYGKNYVEMYDDDCPSWKIRLKELER